MKIKIEKFFVESSACPKRRFLGNCMSKRPAGLVLAKSLLFLRKVKVASELEELNMQPSHSHVIGSCLY